MIMERGGEAWLHSLRSLSYEDCHAQLMTLHGIGAKVRALGTPYSINIYFLSPTGTTLVVTGELSLWEIALFIL